MKSAEEILLALACGRPGCECARCAERGHGRTHCPGHDDTTPSLNVKVAKSGRALVKCFAGCSQSNVIDELRRRDLWSARARSESRIVATYNYVDAYGEPLFEVVRFDPKDFKQRRRGPTGGLIWNVDGVKRTLYRLPEVVRAVKDGRRIYIVEGEKDADRLTGLGRPWHGMEEAVACAGQGFDDRDQLVCATTSPGGAGNWDDSYSKVLFGASADIVVIADRDDAGRRHAQRVAESVHSVVAGAGGASAVVKVIELPGEGVKDAADWVAVGGTRADLDRLAGAAPGWMPAPPETLTTLFEELRAFIARYVILNNEQLDACALWALHSHVLDAAETTPYLHITSAEKRSGKSRLLEVLDLLVARPWLTGRVTTAVLARKIDAERPTLLLDESDAAFRTGDEYAEALRGILNTGHRRSGKYSVCVGQGAKITYRDFATFSPKAIAGIGKLPDTVADRSIRIELKRRAPDERVERFRERNVRAEAAPLRERIERWAESNIERLKNAKPALPEVLNDRAADAWEPLLAIADLACDDTPERARRAAATLSADGVQQDDSIGVRLLGDIRRVFEAKGVLNIATRGENGLIEALASDEASPWAEWKEGQPITPRALANLLKPFGIRPSSVRIGTKTPKGFSRAWFDDAWRRYLPGTGSQSATEQQSAADAAETAIAIRNDMDDVADASGPANPRDLSVVADVADREAGKVNQRAADGVNASEWFPDVWHPFIRAALALRVIEAAALVGAEPS